MGRLTEYDPFDQNRIRNVKGIPVGKSWLDKSGRFLFGKYGPIKGIKGDYAEDVADKDPSYIKWIVETVEDISDEDREVLESLLKFRRK